MIFPYFVANTLRLVIIGIVLMAVPYFAKLLSRWRVHLPTGWLSGVLGACCGRNGA